MEISELYGLFRASKGVNTDTRTLEPGQIFVALKGETFDGNAYAMKALEAGAAYAIVNEYAEGDDPRLLRFPDTLRTLKELAAWHRQQLEIPVIGLTGTNGKTTTKELIREVLATHFTVAATKGNLNNDIGVPLTVLGIGPDAEIAVVEMGANHPDDISALTWVSQPEYGLITNVGKAHLLGFGSFEGVKKAKGQLYDWLSAHDGQAFVNVDDDNLYEMAVSRPLSIIPYGVAGEDAEILPTSAENPFLRMSIGGETLETKLVGAYNAANVMAALAVGPARGRPRRHRGLHPVQQPLPDDPHRAQCRHRGRLQRESFLHGRRPGQLRPVKGRLQDRDAGRHARTGRGFREGACEDPQETGRPSWATSSRRPWKRPARPTTSSGSPPPTTSPPPSRNAL